MMKKTGVIFLNRTMKISFNSENVIELQCLLSDVLSDHEIKLKLVAAVCGH
jgi:hypothetical protein